MKTQTEAKRFFAEKVIHQARAEHVPLTDAERRMLSWSESDPDFNADPQQVDDLASQMSDKEFETKIAGLLTRACAAECAADPHSRDAWQQARSVL